MRGPEGYINLEPLQKTLRHELRVVDGQINEGDLQVYREKIVGALTLVEELLAGGGIVDVLRRFRGEESLERTQRLQFGEEVVLLPAVWPGIKTTEHGLPPVKVVRERRN